MNKHINIYIPRDSIYRGVRRPGYMPSSSLEREWLEPLKEMGVKAKCEVDINGRVTCLVRTGTGFTPVLANEIVMKPVGGTSPDDVIVVMSDKVGADKKYQIVLLEGDNNEN